MTVCWKPSIAGRLNMQYLGRFFAGVCRCAVHRLAHQLFYKQQSSDTHSTLKTGTHYKLLANIRALTRICLGGPLPSAPLCRTSSNSKILLHLPMG